LGVTQTTEHDGARAPSAIRLLHRQAGGLITAIAALGLLGGLAEAAVLLLIVRSALAITERGSEPLIEVPLLGRESLSTAVLVGLGLLTIRFLFQLGGAWLSAEAFARVRLRWLGELVDRSLTSGWEEVADQPEGSLSELASAVVPHAAAAVINLAQLVQQAAALAILLVATFAVNAVSALVAIVALGVLALVIRPIGRLIRSLATRTIQHEQELATGVAEVTRSLLEVRAFGVGPQVSDRLMAHAGATAHIWRRVNFSSQATLCIYQAAALGLILGGIGVLGHGSPERLAGLGTIVLILIRAFAYGQQLQAQVSSLHAAAPAVLRVDEALHSLRSAPEEATGVAVPRPLEEMRLSGVGYWYRPGQPVLEDLDMEVLSGEVVGLRGASGSGKTTLLHILLGLRAPRVGTFDVNGVDVAAISPAAWRSAVAFIPQEPMLIEGTIAENIRFFRPSLTEEQVHGAALRAGLGPDLAVWPEGLDRLVGQRRHGVSGGQRQRITIARALAGDPLILLMDEPTSSLDEEAERVVLETLGALRGQLTVVVAAHRVSTLALCDRVVELERSVVDAERQRLPQGP
jgi:ABC-type multidrug transport system fused ATPase/permease subunit